MLSIIALIAVLGVNPESEAALLDRAAQPHPYHAYLTTSTCPPEKREDLVRLLRFVVPSLSHKTYLADQLPQPVTIRRQAPSGEWVIERTNLLRLDLTGLGWEHTYNKVILEQYPYRPDLTRYGHVPIVVDGLWFAANMLDAVETKDAQYLLLYGKALNRDEFLKFWGVDTTDPQFLFGLIPKDGEVSVEGERQIESFPMKKRAYAWGTGDARNVAGKTDFLANLKTLLNTPHDAEEWLVGMFKTMHGESGCLQAALLSTDKGVRQEVAPTEIVHNLRVLRGGVGVRNSSDCIMCHPKGIREPVVRDTGHYADAFREYIEGGARIAFKDKNQQRDVDRYFTSNLRKEILANQELYEAGVAMCNGMTGEENTANYVAFVRLYDAPVDIEQAAREQYSTPEELRFAIADYGRLYPQARPRFAQIAQPGQKISRKQWKGEFDLARYAVEIWRYSQR